MEEKICFFYKNLYSFCVQRYQRITIYCVFLIMAIYKVQKRNGSITTFDRAKIERAIRLAIDSV